MIQDLSLQDYMIKLGKKIYHFKLMHIENETLVVEMNEIIRITEENSFTN